MRFETAFIGNESSYLVTLESLSNLTTVVSEPIFGASKNIFGSAHQFAKERNIKIVPPPAFIKKPGKADIIIVSGYSKRIPRNVIESARVAIINIHQSLLPAYRGRHPLNWAIINGESFAGVTIHHISERFDEGNIILQKRVKISAKDNIMDLHWRTVEKGRNLLKNFFQRAKAGNLNGFKQDPHASTYFPPRAPGDGKIDWAKSAENICNLVRALTYPYPGAYFYFRRKKLVIEDAQVVLEGPSRVEEGIPVFYKRACLVKTGAGYLRINRLRNKVLSEIRSW